MNPASYKEYLAYLEEAAKPSVLKRISISILLVLFVMLGAASTGAYYWTRYEEPLLQKKRYLEIASSAFVSTQQSLAEVETTFQVAGAKTQIVDSLIEGSASAGFVISLDDISKGIAKIEAVKKEIEYQQKQLAALIAPGEFTNLYKELSEYLVNAEKLMGTLEADYDAQKESILAAGPTFYLPTITNESIWTTRDKEALIAYYEKIKLEANDALASIAKLNPAPEFVDYYATQLDYLELAVTLSDSLIATLSGSENQDPEEATQVEKAYQQLSAAKIENDLLQSKLLAHKRKIVSPKQSLSGFDQIISQESSLENMFKSFAAYQDLTLSQKTRLELEKFYRVYK